MDELRSASEEAALPGEFGPYRVVRLLQKGGMGSVYEVEHGQLGVRYALKLFTLDHGAREMMRDKFQAEGRILARLVHPGLVRVFHLDVDARTGNPYFVMDLVLDGDGATRTLADVDTDALDERQVLAWFGELAEVLDYVHAQGIVHRDVKPGNVLVDAVGHVRLTDFGVSRLFGQCLREEVHAVTTCILDATTGSQLVLGTRGFLAPEVARGGAATPAADVYSLGVLILYLLTGMWYEKGARALDFLDALERPWRKVLESMLEEDPAARPGTLAPLVRELSAAAPQGRARVARPHASRLKARTIVGIAAGVALALAVGTLLHGTLRGTSMSPRDIDAELADLFGPAGIYEVQR